MAKILVLYGTNEGHTAKIAEHIGALATVRGHLVDLIDGRQLPDGFSPHGYDAIVIGASIHYGRHQPCVRKFVRRYRGVLAHIPSAFFSVSLTARQQDAEHMQKAQQFISKFTGASGWRPNHAASFPGALLYSRYGPVKRLLMRTISAMARGDTDTSRDYDYTDWGRVKAFAEEFLAALR